jgi:serine/threonine protein kinase/Flp pilus assembly protein TadD
MNPERWQQINQAFDETLAQPVAGRAAFLAVAYAGDDSLRRRVEAMLAADARADSLLDNPAHEAAGALLVSSAEELEADDLSGSAIGPYRLLRELGRGGMGQVYLAHDERLNRQVALKVLPTHLTGEADRVARFQREARAASALNHPNILTIYDFGQQADRHYIAAEFVEGRTLRALIGQPECTLAQSLDITIQVASALAAAHAAGIIHRDIKPENLMLRPDGFVKVLDFGLAKLAERQRDRETERQGDGETEKMTLSVSPSLRLSVSLSSPHTVFQAAHTTSPGTVMGTIAYMSPEQAQGLDVDARSDLFSLGIVFDEMLTGERWFQGQTSAEASEPASLSGNLFTATPEAARAELQRIVRRSLAQSIEQRYQSAGELLNDLKKLQQDLAFTARAQPDLPRAGRLSWRKRSIAALAALVLLSALTMRWWNRTDNAPNSIAVLPFVNTGDDAQMAYLPDGLTESLIGSLSQLPGLNVMARSTVFTYQGRAVDPRQVGADLQVRAVVTGRVQRLGERVIIRAELVDASTGARLWGAEYERPLADLPAVEREITREISAALRPQLSDDAQQQLTRRQSPNSEAYRLYLLGRHLYLQNTRASLEKALAYFQQAIALDPSYALAYSGVSEVYSTSSAQYLPPSEAIPRAREAALAAVRLDETLPEAQHALARVRLWGDWDWAGAEEAYQRARELNPSFVLGRADYAHFLTLQGRFGEALREAQHARELDPLSPQASRALGSICYAARRYDEALAHFRKMLELNPANAVGHLYTGLVFSQQGRHQEALDELRQAFALNSQHTFRAWLAYGYARAGQRDQALKLLRELETLARHERVSPVYLARIYIGLGDRNRAFAWLNQAYAERSDHLLGLGYDPAYDPLRADPRFSELLHGIGLAP